MVYDFDRVIDRTGTMAEKYDFIQREGYPADVTPLWVADMEFATAQPVLDALHRRVDHGIFGYTETGEAYAQAVRGWWERHYQFTFETGWLVKTPTIVYSLATAVRAFTQPGDPVLIQQPVYHPFKNVVVNNGRVPVSNDLVLRDGKYYMDFEGLEKTIQAHNIKLMLFCSPHNPVGRSWTPEELARLGEICHRHGVIVVADEIHCDFTWWGGQHTVLLNAAPCLRDRCILCISPSKTFNLAGLQVANNIIPNPELRERFVQAKERPAFDECNVLGIVACMAAYNEGEEWYQQLKSYLEGNIRLVEEFVAEKLPGVTMIHPEATYLLWLDFKGLGLPEEEVTHKLLYEAKLWLNRGSMFGPTGAGFQRLNAACPRSTLESALARMRQTFCK